MRVILLLKMSQPTAPSERLIYLNLSTELPLRGSMESPLCGSTINEHHINDKIQDNNKFNNNINIIKDIRNHYETETNNYNKKLIRFKNFINVAEITEVL